MEEKLLDEILEQLNNQGKIDISILIILGILFFVFVVKQLAEIFFTRQATKNEKKGDEELYISQKQYETETMIFLEFSERRYSICTKINSISKEKGSINVSKKDNYEKIYEELVKEYEQMRNYLNKYMCFVPNDIWEKFKKYMDSISNLLEIWKQKFSKGLIDVINTEDVNNVIEEIENQNKEINESIRRYVYKKRKIL
jgi:hypothetical protein